MRSRHAELSARPESERVCTTVCLTLSLSLSLFLSLSFSLFLSLSLSLSLTLCVLKATQATQGVNPTVSAFTRPHQLHLPPSLTPSLTLTTPGAGSSKTSCTHIMLPWTCNGGALNCRSHVAPIEIND